MDEKPATCPNCGAFAGDWRKIGVRLHQGQEEAKAASMKDRDLEDDFDQRFHAEWQAQYKSSMAKYGKVAMASGPFFDIARDLFAAAPQPPQQDPGERIAELEAFVRLVSEADPAFVSATYRAEAAALQAKGATP